MPVEVPPPSSIRPIADPKSGFATRDHFDFLQRLWDRSGGDEDAADDAKMFTWMDY